MVLAASRIVYVVVETTGLGLVLRTPTVLHHRDHGRLPWQSATAKTVDVDTETKVAELSSRTNINGDCSEKQVNVTLFSPPEELLPSVDNLAEIDHGFQLRRPRSQPA